MPALGAGVRCVARRAGILAPSTGVKKVLTRPRLTACPPSRGKFSPRGNAEEGAAGLARVLRECSGIGPGAAGVLRGICGSLPGGLLPSDSFPFRDRLLNRAVSRKRFA